MPSRKRARPTATAVSTPNSNTTPTTTILRIQCQEEILGTVVAETTRTAAAAAAASSENSASNGDAEEETAVRNQKDPTDGTTISTEIGYFWLPNERISIQTTTGSTKNGDEIVLRTWQDVTIWKTSGETVETRQNHGDERDSPGEGANRQYDGTTLFQWREPQSLGNNKDGIRKDGGLPKEPDSIHKNNNLLCLSQDTIAPAEFDGTVESLFRNKNHQTTQHQEEDHDDQPEPPVSSDLACLLSLLAQFPDICRLASCQVCLMREEGEERRTTRGITAVDHADKEADDENRDDSTITTTTRIFQAAVVVTVTFPQLLTPSSLEQHQPRGLLAAAAVPSGRRKTSRAVKFLHPTLQLILSLVRSDWETLEQNKRGVSNSRDSTTPQSHSRTAARQKKRLFPNRVSLEELYLGMEGTTTRGNDDADLLPSPEEESAVINADTKNDRPENSNKTCCDNIILIQHLPREILAEKIAPFLNAPDLDAWRATSRFFHKTLQAVVPGLNPNIRLYRHQITSLAWMRRCEVRPLTEKDCLKRPGSSTGRQHYFHVPDGDWHRAATAGSSTLLSTRDGRWHCRVSQTTGLEMMAADHVDEHVANRSLARGGLLADEPGLGKTITVLSLILQTSGLTTTRDDALTDSSPNDNNTDATAMVDGSNDDDQGTRKAEEEIFKAYWKESVPPIFRQEDLNSLTNRLARANKTGLYLHFAPVRAKINKDSYVSSFDDYVQDVVREINLAFSEDDEDNPSQRRLGQSLEQTFQEMVQAYKTKQIHSASKSYSKVRSHPNSSVASLYEAYEKRKFINSLIASKGTLLVVPAVLLDHWRDQIKEHVNFAFMAKKKPLVFEYTTSKGAQASLQTAMNRVMVEETHSATVFIDRAPSKPLPSADFLARFHIVITSNSRFTYEWKNGSFQNELKRMEDAASGANNLEYVCFDSLNRGDSACPLLKIHWLRLVVDEGHTMGRQHQNSCVQFASWVSAERRWAMTGTPTKHGASAINEVLALTRYLQHDFFTSRCDGDSHWKKSVARMWKDQHLVGYFRLRSLLSLILKRHTKLDIAELPPPLFHCESIPMSHSEVETYNTIVTAVSSNLVLTSLKEDARQDSLLHVSNRKYASEALANVRRVCVGFSRVLPTLTDRHWRETIEFANKFGLEEEAISRVRQFMYSAENGKQSDCQCCGLSLSVLLITPCCGSFICTDCVSCDVHKENGREVIECFFCDRMFSVDRFQKFQPGFAFEWLDNLENGKKPHESKGGGERIAHDLLPSAQNAVGPAAAAPPAPAGELPIIRPQTERRRTRKPGDGHECIFDRYATDGKCTLCLLEHDACNLLRTGRCNVCHRASIECPEEESKSSYLVSRLLSLANRRQSSTERNLKVIVFSQYRKALNLVGDRLLRRFGAACVAEYWGKYRTQELRKFKHSAECFCMLLGNDGSEGLDLSFVSHIFFLEEIWDRSRADQAVARAWRMGATGRVEVETLLAQNSVEETMQKYEAQQHQAQSSSGATSTAAELSSSKEYQVAKTQQLLKSLEYITEFQSFRRSASPFDKKEDKTEPSAASSLEAVNQGWKRSLGVEKGSTVPLPEAKRQRRVGFKNL